jgi:hypothetical protein
MQTASNITFNELTNFLFQQGEEGSEFSNCFMTSICMQRCNRLQLISSDFRDRRTSSVADESRDIFSCGDRMAPLRVRVPASRRRQTPIGGIIITPSEKGAATSNNLSADYVIPSATHTTHTLSLSLSHTHTHTSKYSNAARCMAAGLHACRLLPMKSFPDVDLRFALSWGW